MLNYKRFTFNYRHSVFYCISKYYLHGPPYVGHGRFSSGDSRRSYQPCVGTLLGEGDRNLPEAFRGQGSRSDKQEDNPVCAECGLKNEK